MRQERRRFPVKNQAYRMALLFDFYGDLLTDHQKEFFDLYYNEDLSLAEIAENYGITRQGVRDVIARAEAALTELEDKTGIIRRFLKMRDGVSAIEEATAALDALNDRKYHDQEIYRLARRISETLTVFKE